MDRMADQSGAVASGSTPLSSWQEGYETGLDQSALCLLKAAKLAGHDVSFVDLKPRGARQAGRYLRITANQRNFLYCAGALHATSVLDFDRPGPQINGIAEEITCSRGAVRARLEAASVPTPAGRTFGKENSSGALDYATGIGGRVRIAADDRNNNFSRIADSDNRAELESAITALFSAADTGDIVEYLEGQTVRFLYVEPNVVGVQLCRPPSVVGDGQSTVVKLIADRNADRELANIPGHVPISANTVVVKVLRSQGYGLRSVLPRGARVFLASAPGTALGTEWINCDDDVHASHVRLAERAFRAIPDLLICSLDMKLHDFRMAAENENCHVENFDCAPPIEAFHRPWEGPPRAVATAIVDLLGRREFGTPQILSYEKILGAAIDHFGRDEQCLFKAGQATGVPIELADVVRDGRKRRSLAFNVNDQRYYFRGGSLRVVADDGSTQHINGTAVAITRDKAAVKAILAAEGISTPAGTIFKRNQIADARRYAADAGHSLCVKPNRGQQGLAVFPDCIGPGPVDSAFREVAARYREVLVEENVVGEQIRLFYVKPNVVAVSHHKLPVVIGDGRQSLLALIDQRNKRARDLHANEVATSPALVRRLAEQGFDLGDVPGVDFTITLNHTAHISRGAAAIEIRDKIHPSYLEKAEAACRAIDGLVIAGVDMIVTDYTQPADDHNYWILEVNSSSSIYPAYHPWEGRPQDVGGAIIDFLHRNRPSASAAIDRGGSGPTGRDRRTRRNRYSRTRLNAFRRVRRGL